MTGTWQALMRGGVTASLFALSTLLVAAEPRDATPDVDRSEAVDLFEAIQAQDLDVKLIPKDATEARLIVANKTNKPLTVRMPDAFAGVPVLAQVGIGGGAGGGGGGANTQQAVGGGGMGMGGMGMGGMGMMSIPPEKVAKFRFPIVCLEHGKKDPRPGIPYDIQPLETVTSEPGVKELLVALGSKKLSQRAAQAATWHLANGLTWQQLAAKRIVHLNGTSELWFHPNEIRAGIQIARLAMLHARQNDERPKSPGETVSLNQAIGGVEE